MGSNYLIVGGTSGIGKSLATLINSEDTNLYVMARTEPDSPGTSISYIEHDVREENWPSDRLPDHLNGLAYAPGSITLKPFERTPVETFEEDWSINVEGAIRTLQECSSLLKNVDEHSNVVLFSTVACHIGMKYHASIASAKSAVEGLAKSLAAEWAPTVRVNVIAPSLTETPMAESLVNNDRKREKSVKRHPLRSLADPDQVASIAESVLVGDSHMTGQVIKVDGGLSTVEKN